MDPRVISKKGPQYSPDLKQDTPLFLVGWEVLSICRGCSQHIVSSADKVDYNVSVYTIWIFGFSMDLDKTTFGMKKQRFIPMFNSLLIKLNWYSLANGQISLQIHWLHLLKIVLSNMTFCLSTGDLNKKIILLGKFLLNKVPVHFLQNKMEFSFLFFLWEILPFYFSVKQH